jgi:hypothetical protein
MRLLGIIIVVAAAATGLSAPAHAEKLSGDAIKQLLSGTTAEYKTLGGLASRDEFRPDGTLHSEIDTPRGVRRSDGQWWTDETAQLCRLLPKRNLSPNCLTLYREGGEIYAGKADAPDRMLWKLKK